MKITDLILTLVRWDTKATGMGGRRVSYGGVKQLGVLKIQTDEGVEGHAFLGSSRQGADAFAGPMLELLKPVVIGRNPLDIGAIWAEMWKYNRYVSYRAIGAIDVALWDIAGKAAGLPIHRLLGSCRQKVPAYASSAYIPTPQDYAEEALYFKSRGWTAYKIHPHGVPREDMAIIREVKKQLGDSLVLMLDSMWSYQYEDALRVGLEAQELGYFWYEDPLAEDDIYAYLKLKQKLTIPILATEYTPGGLYGLADWVRQQATDILRGDVALKAGLTPMVKIAHMAEAFRMKCEIHHGGNSLNNVANLHLTMAIPNCDYFEVLLPDSANKYGLVQDIEVDQEGYVHAPQEHGLGYEIDWDLVQRETTQVLH
jgi:L-alanine-DL-glutamate epimerase-like enolase superfamily enzyme